MRIQIFLFFIIYQSGLFAQNITVSGYIEDMQTGERLIGASVFEALSKTGTTSNSYGFFSISFTQGDSVRLFFSYVGYETFEITAILKENKQLNIKLKPNLMLNEVVITASQDIPIEQKTEMSIVSIPIKQVKLLPSLGGESDVLKAIQLMPGVQSGNEGTSGLYVRGGSPDQNLMVLDDVPLYYVNHLGGLVSIFNTDAISNINLIKGGFPARYGNRLSSVMDIRMKDGNLKEVKCNAMIGMVASKISIEGPIKQDTSSYIISFRRFMYDLITRPLSKIVFDKVSAGYTFYDFNAKFNYKLSDNDRLYLSVYSGKDKMTIKMKDNSDNSKYMNRSSLGWGNNLIAVRWNHLFNTKLFSNTTISYSQYKYNTEFENNNKTGTDKETIFNRFTSGINDLAIKFDIEYYHSTKYKLVFGANSIYHTFIPGSEKFKHNTNSSAITDTIFGNYSLHALDNAIYIENIFQLGKGFSINAGVRFSHYYVEDTNFVNLEPRILVNCSAGENNSIKASYSQMYQNIHLLTSSGTGMPTDLWLPATKNVIPQKSTQYALGAASTRKFYNQNYEISIEFFYKELQNLIAYKTGANVFGSTVDWQDKIEKNGKGASKGIELLINKKTGKITGWIGYTYSKTTRQFENINDGISYLFKYDRPHDISIVVMHNLNKNINFSLTWVYGTGNAITLPVSAYSIMTETGLEQIYVYEGINTFRMRDYHKMDIGFNFNKEKKWGTRTWSISVYNLYNRKNPYYYFFEKKSNNSDEVVLKQLSMFPIMPSVSYSISF
jgi:hypothetical protein